MQTTSQKPSAWRTPQEVDQERALSLRSKVDTTKSEIVEESTKDDDVAYLVDIGANLADKRFSHDMSEVVQRAIDAGVRNILITGTSIAASKRAILLARTLPGILFATAGVHPHDAKSWLARTNDELRRLVEENKDIVKAVGECGLDFDRNFSTPEQQIKAFREQLELACELNLPVFLHERSAFDQLISILKEYRPRLRGGVVHCFTGSQAECEAYLSLDMHIGITGWICDERRGMGLREVVKHIPWNRLMIET